MIKVNFRKKGLIGICLVAAICVMGVGAHSLRAAGRVDTTANVKITAAVASSDTSIFAQNYKGEVGVKLYKLASLNEAGTLIPQSGYESLDLDALPKEITEQGHSRHRKIAV